MVVKLPPHWVLRPGTTDRQAAEHAIVRNEYDLPAHFERDDVVLDLGAQTGAFAYAALSRGAGAVHCYESRADNVKLLRRNLQIFPGRVFIHYASVTGAGAAAAGAGEAEGLVVPVFRFDELVDAVTQHGKRRVRLLKVDCVRGDWSVLRRSRRVALLDEVCGQYDAQNSPAVQAFVGFLQCQGFQVRERALAQAPERVVFCASRNPARGLSLTRFRQWWHGWRAA
jgi:hypothetical protein